MSIKNDLFLRTLKGDKVSRPPVWLMRQAGRILPQYRAIRSSLSGFKELLFTPDLAAEVSVQPVDELGVDACIVFSDILVIPEAMGLDYSMVEKKGPLFNKTIDSVSDIKNLVKGEAVVPELNYVFEAVKRTKQRLDGRVPLIGFSGAPWTLMAYMIEGQGSKTFSKAKKFLYQNEEASHQLLEAITDSIIAYLKQKIVAGVDAVQIFDSWAGMLSADLYKRFMIRHLRRICDEITEVPVILFSKGAYFALNEFKDLNCDAVGLDWAMNPALTRQEVGPNKILQGNADPCLLYADKDQISREVKNMIERFKAKHIVNLGHGVYPDTPLENVKTFVNSVKEYKYS